MTEEDFEMLCRRLARQWDSGPKSSKEIILKEWPALYKILDSNAEALSRHRLSVTSILRKSAS